MNDTDPSSTPPGSTPAPKPATTPPPMGAPAPAQTRAMHLTSKALTRLRAEYQPLEHPPSPARTTDGLLKNPVRLVYELTEGRHRAVLANLGLLALFGLAAYGLVMGMFSGGAQLWAVPLKLVGGTLFAALICLPSLYIFSALSGAEVSLRTLVGLMAGSLALEALLLIGFAPVSWVFTVSTQSVPFMGFLHLMVWMVAVTFGLRFLHNGLRLQEGVRLDVMFVWFTIFILVSLQMSTTLRPLVGEFEPGVFAEEKRFFFDHWFKALAEDRPLR